MYKIVWMLAIPLLFQSAWGSSFNTGHSSSANYTAREKVYHYILGSTQVSVQVSVFGNRKNVVMLNLHDDEITSVEAARNVLKQSGGVLVNINNNYERLITFQFRGKSYVFDPNRMFTRIGIMADLVKQNNTCNLAAAKAIEGFAKFLLSKIPKTSTLIALHNNDQNNFSIGSYLVNEDHKKDVQAIFTNDTHDQDNFYLTTDRKLYNTLRGSGYNVILQHKKAADDGSLSVYYGRRNKSYVNIEAEIGQVKQQEQMIGRVVAWINKEITKGI